MNYSEKWMTRAMEVAQKGWGDSKPNPSVGAVIVFDNKEVASAHSASSGGPHAEAQAIQKALDIFKEKGLGATLKGCQLFVTLEPCSHYGKNPPCSLAVFESEISEVYYGVKDQNPKVSGASWLKERGVKCELVDLDGRLPVLYRGFFYFINKQLPYVVVKVATDSKGTMAKVSAGQAVPLKITGETAKAFTHNLRSWAHAVGVSTQTLKADNPNLSNRMNPQEWGGQPTAVVWGRSLGESLDFEILKRENTQVFLSKDKEHDFKNYFEGTLQELGQKGFHQILIEAGPAFAQLLLDWGGVNEWVLLESSKDLSSEIGQGEMPLCLNEGFKSQLLEQYSGQKSFVLGEDQATHYFRPF